jgi:hypothetical protein
VNYEIRLISGCRDLTGIVTVSYVLCNFGHGARFYIPKIRKFLQRMMVYLTVAQKPKSGLGCLIVEVSRSHTIINPHTALRNPWKGDQLVAESRYLHSTKQTQETSICTLSGIRTPDPRNQAASDRHLRPHGHGLRPEDLLALLTISLGSVILLFY